MVILQYNEAENKSQHFQEGCPSPFGYNYKVIVSDDGQGYSGKIDDVLRQDDTGLWYKVSFDPWHEVEDVDGEDLENRPRVRIT